MLQGWDEFAPWLNRAGMILTFISFWLAAPEILGEDRLKAIESTLSRLSAGASARTAEGSTAIGTGAWRLLPIALLAIMPVNCCLALSIFGIVRWPGLDALQHWVQVVTYVIVGMWVTGLVGLVLPRLLLALTSKVLGALADNQSRKRRWLVSGAVVFVIGSLMQFAATFG